MKVHVGPDNIRGKEHKSLAGSPDLDEEIDSVRTVSYTHLTLPTKA